MYSDNVLRFLLFSKSGHTLKSRVWWETQESVPSPVTSDKQQYLGDCRGEETLTFTALRARHQPMPMGTIKPEKASWL